MRRSHKTTYSALWIILIAAIFVLLLAKIGGASYLSKLSTYTQQYPRPTEFPQATAGAASAAPIDLSNSGLSSYSDLPLATAPQEPITVQFLVEHRSALNGKTIQVRGIVVNTLLGEKACPQNRGQGNVVAPGMCAQGRIFLADTQGERNTLYDTQVLVPEETQESEFQIGQRITVKVFVSGNKQAVTLRKVE